ncbi:MAG: glutamine synthetase family protein [Rubrimonas sp.]
MTGKLTLEDLRDAAAVGAIDTVIVAVVDMQGRLMGKRLRAQHFVEEGWKGAQACLYLLATDYAMETVPGYRGADWDRGHGDMGLKPDLDTLRRVPWLEATALVLCDAVERADGRPIPHSPRALLKAQIARLAAHGLRANAATELEFHLFAHGYAAAEAQGHRGLQTLNARNLDYHILQTSMDEPLLRAIREGLAGADIPVEGGRGEASPGQHEINVRHADALAMADRHAIIKNAIKEIAHAHGRAATFMAKWSDAHAGSSAHAHVSLTDAKGRPAFHDAGAEHGMSATMRHFLAGWLANADALTLLLAPNVNSYKRFADDSFAPTRAVWSLDNRSAAFRVCGAGGPGVRVECRIGGADMNPHVALAALIAAGLDGIERGLSPEPPATGYAYAAGPRSIPRTLRDAIAALDASPVFRAAFGDAVVEHYLHAARWEQAAHDRHVTDWEVRRGFEQA